MLADQPFLAEYGKQADAWKSTSEALAEVGVNAGPKSIQDRFKNLVKLFKSESRASLRRSGTEEEYDERERLLQEIVDLEATVLSRKAEKAATKGKKDQNIGNKIRQDALAEMREKRLRQDEDSVASTSTRQTDDEPQPKRKMAQSRIEKDFQEFVDRKEKLAADQLATERLKVQLEANKLELEREKLRLKEEKARQNATRLEAELKDREADRQSRVEMVKSQSELLKAQMAFVAELSKHLGKQQ